MKSVLVFLFTQCFSVQAPLDGSTALSPRASEPREAQCVRREGTDDTYNCTFKVTDKSAHFASTGEDLYSATFVHLRRANGDHVLGDESMKQSIRYRAQRATFTGRFMLDSMDVVLLCVGSLKE